MSHAAAELTSVHRTFVSKRRLVRALDGVDLHIAPGECVGLVGESGSGKSTLARILMGLDAPTGGTARLWDHDVARIRRRDRAALRRRIGVVFQDPYSSLNPSLSLGSIVGEPLAVHRFGTRMQRRRRVSELLRAVGIDPLWADRAVSRLSGGQRQRVAIARAIALDPELLILDEPVSALDVSVQAQVLNVLSDLQEQMHFGALFISHDLAVIRRVADTVAVMYLGRIVEQAPAATLFDNPQHPYTIALMSSISEVEVSNTPQRILLKGDPPSPIDLPSGCRFRTRCFRAQSDCAATDPALRPVAGTAASVACLHPGGLSPEEIDPKDPSHPSGSALAGSGRTKPESETK